MNKGLKCYSCNCRMRKTSKKSKFKYRGKVILVEARCFVCESCGEVLYSIEEAKRIESILRQTVPPPAV